MIQRVAKSSGHSLTHSLGWEDRLRQGMTLEQEEPSVGVCVCVHAHAYQNSLEPNLHLNGLDGVGKYSSPSLPPPQPQPYGDHTGEWRKVEPMTSGRDLKTL